MRPAYSTNARPFSTFSPSLLSSSHLSFSLDLVSSDPFYIHDLLHFIEGSRLLNFLPFSNNISVPRVSLKSTFYPPKIQRTTIILYITNPENGGSSFYLFLFFSFSFFFLLTFSLFLFQIFSVLSVSVALSHSSSVSSIATQECL